MKYAENIYQSIFKKRIGIQPDRRGEVAIYCQCDEENPSLADVSIIELENWVNGNSGCKKNQNSDRFIVSKDLDSMKIVALESREIQCCQKSDRIFPRLQSFCPGA